MSSVGSPVSSGFTNEPHLDAATSIQHSSTGVAKLLANLASVAPQQTFTTATTGDAKYENKLAIVRLGMATALYSALRAKHPPSASHSLRVALVCSAWSDRLRFDQAQRDRLEVAALLHDIGKIGIPDPILRKPGKLTVEEQLTVGLVPQLGCEILRGCCGDQELLDIILHANDWYSNRGNQTTNSDATPIGSKMLGIADAFDAMTTDHVYRPAMCRQAALQQLSEGSGTQFDPELIRDFCEMMLQDPAQAHRQVLLRWLQTPADQSSDQRWSIHKQPMFQGTSIYQVDARSRYHDQLLSNMNDGVIYIDSNGIIQGWNPAAEKLTGIAAGAVLMNAWAPNLIGLNDDQGDVHEKSCPVHCALSTAAPVSGRYNIRRIDGTNVPIRLHVAPVTADQPGLCGVVLIAQDTSQQQDLEDRVESLHIQATHDPLTKVANRAAFDRRLTELVSHYVETGASFSLIICDIDHFKRVNDLHGHLAGDEALVSFASMLSGHSREGDLVSRYGGEEFVLLSPNCDITTASERAEVVRAAVENNPLPSIGNQPVTASFGVTEVQAGDSPDSVLARADRALLQAKDHGRNQVIQLGGGSAVDSINPAPKKRRGIWSWLDNSSENVSLKTEITTPVPANLAIEKLRGFISDHKAEIINVSESNLQLRLSVFFGATNGRRSVDSQISFNVRLVLCESSHKTGLEHRKVAQIRTLVKVDIEPARTRDRRRQEVSLCANQVALSLKSYLMGSIELE